MSSEWKYKTLTFNNKVSSELGLVIQTTPKIEFPEKDMSSTHVPGRNGDLYIDNGSYKNIARSYNLAKGYELNPGTVTQADEVLSWLTSANGKYVRLEDEYDPDVYRLAMFNQSGSFQNYFDKALAIQVSFICKPQRFLKYGENEVEITDGEITNPTNYPSLPKIKMEGLPTDLSKILMFTITDNDGNITSNITLSGIDGGIVYIDSEAQNCYNDDGDVNEYVGLNGGNFPVLYGDTNTLDVNLYTSERGSIKSYNEIVKDSQDVCKSEYKPIDTLNEIRQKKFTVKPYMNLVDEHKKKYLAKSYLGLCDDVSESYTFVSFNSILSSYSDTYQFYGEAVSSVDYPDWASVAYDSSENVMKVYANRDSYYLPAVSGVNTIRLYGSGDLLASVKIGSTVSITCYKTLSGQDIYLDGDIVSDEYALDVMYDDVPDWVKFRVVYSTKNNLITPTKIEFITGAIGYFWKAGSGILAKDSWTKYNSVNQVLDTLTWNTQKKAFMSLSGFNLSTTTKFTYKYMVNAPTVYPDKENEYASFTVQPSLPLTTLNIKANDTGYYCYSINGGDISEWTEKQSGTTIVSDVASGKSFDIYYLETLPTYANEVDEEGHGLPDWVDPMPIFEKTDKPLNSKYFKFISKVTTNYRNTIKIIPVGKTEEEEVYTEWVETEEDDYVKTLYNNVTKDLEIKLDEILYLCQIDEEPTKYDNDRCFNDTPDIPEWLTLEYVTTDPDEDKHQIIYKVPENSTEPDKIEYYKWDINTSWVAKKPGDILLTTGYKDDTVFYHMTSQAQYDTYDFDDLLNIKPVYDNFGNPTEIIFTIKENADGYYKVNFDSDWKYFKAGQELVTSTVGETTVVNHLVKTDDSTDSISIYITPNWWIL